MAEHIVMIHGMWCGDWVWSHYRNFFEAREYHCITPTLRYHDRATMEINRDRIGTTSLLDYAQDLEEEICKLDQRPVLMGHSMGGLLAQILGSRGLAKALVLLTPASPRGVLALRPSVVRSFWSNMIKPGFWHRPMVQTFGEAVYSMLQLLPVEEQMEIYTRFVPESGRAGFEIGFWLIDPKRAARVETPRITCPTLIVSGAQDRITPPSVVRSVADKYRAVTTLVEYPNHAHWVLGEPGWYEIAETCSDWLERVLARKPQRPAVHHYGTVWSKVRAGRVLSEYRERWFPPQHGNRRMYDRREAVLGVEAGIPYSGNAQYYDVGKTLNLSRGGMYLESDLRLEEGTYVNADLRFADSERPLWVQGRIVRSADKGVAVAFSHVEQNALSKLTSPA